MVNAFQTVSLSPTSLLLPLHSPLLLEVFASVLGSTLCVRAQVTELSAHPSSLTVIYAGHICLPPFLHVCVCVCILAAAWQCVCVWEWVCYVVEYFLLYQ